MLGSAKKVGANHAASGSSLPAPSAVLSPRYNCSNFPRKVPPSARVPACGMRCTPGLDCQLDALNDAGCERALVDRGSGGASIRPNLAACPEYLRQGDVLVVLDLDRLGR